MTSLTGQRQRRIIFLKTIALLSIVRWQNIVTTAVAQYLAALYTLNPGRVKWEVLADINLHLIVLATALTIAGGYIINNFYDAEKDMINRPAKVKFQRIISRRFVLQLYLLLNVLAFAVALLASWRVCLFFIGFSFALWLYSHKLQRITVVRELVASILSVTAWFSVGLYYQYMTIPIFLFGVYVVTILFTRELIKDMASIKGDTVYGYKTIPVVWGINRSKNLVIGLSIFSVSILLYLLAINPTLLWYILFTVSFLIIILINSSLIHAQRGRDVPLHWLYRILVVLSVWGIALV